MPYSMICNDLKNANCTRNTSDTSTLCRDENAKIAPIHNAGGNQYFINRIATLYQF